MLCSIYIVDRLSSIVFCLDYRHCEKAPLADEAISIT